MLVGEIVYLRSIEKDDLEVLRNWRNIPNFKKNFREYREVSKSMQIDWFENIVNGDRNTIMFAICEKQTNKLLGCCGLCYINWVQRFADISLYIGHKGLYIDNEGFAKEACKLLFDYAFNELAMHKVWTELYEYDEKKIEFYTKEFSFKKDGVLRDNHYMYGKWWDSWILSLLAREFI